MNASVQDTMKNKSMRMVIKYSPILELNSVSVLQIKYTLKKLSTITTADNEETSDNNEANVQSVFFI